MYVVNKSKVYPCHIFLTWNIVNFNPTHIQNNLDKNMDTVRNVPILFFFIVVYYRTFWKALRFTIFLDLYFIPLTNNNIFPSHCRGL